jgi:hypothetical protein
MMRALGPLALLLSGCNVVIGLDELTPPVAPATRVTLARAFGSARQQAITAVAVDADGFLVVAGHNDGSFSLGGEDLVNADGRDLFVAKLDRDGNHVWSVPFEATGTSYASDLALGQSEEIVVAGYFGGTLGIADPPFVSDGRDAFVLKLRSDGEVLWAAHVDGALEETPYSVAIDSSQHVLVAGDFAGTIHHGDETSTAVGREDGFLLELDKDGGHLRLLHIGGGPEWEQVGAVATDGTDILIGGTASVPIAFGAKEVPALGGSDVFVAKLDSGADDLLWGGPLGDAVSNCNDRCDVALAVGPDGRVALAASYVFTLTIGSETYGPAAPWGAVLAELEPHGNAEAIRPRWSAGFDGPGEQRPSAIAYLPNAGPVVVGTFDNQVDFDGTVLSNADFVEDVFVTARDAAGNPSWTAALAITSVETDEIARPDVAVTREGDVVVVGSFHDLLQVQAHTLVSAVPTSEDAFIVILQGGAP